jgi:inner membrane protein
MDSLTQITLGAAVGVAVMGRRTAVWKAALWGGIAGTLPDLDVVVDHGDAVLNMVRHRAESHSFFYLTLASPLLAWLVSRIHSEPRSARTWGSMGQPPGRPKAGPAPLGGSDPRSGGAWGSNFLHWWLALWLVLITHPLLDTMTVYGTQLLMPFTDHPFGIGSVFIIDPAYTLPLIAGVVAALRMKDRGRGLRWNAAALVLSTLYLGWSAFAQQHVDRVARASLQEQGIAAQGLLVTPAPFSTVLWRLVATTPDRYFEGYYSLFDARPTVRWTAYPRGAALIEQPGDNDSVARIAAFSHGFFSLQALDGHLMLTDLRMGQEPAYIFRFDVGALDAVGAQPPTQLGMRADLGRSLPWLWERLLGTDVPLPVDANRDSTAVAANL